MTNVRSGNSSRVQFSCGYENNQPYHGDYFITLKEQEAHASGAAMHYLDGEARHEGSRRSRGRPTIGRSGVMTFWSPALSARRTLVRTPPG